MIEIIEVGYKIKIEAKVLTQKERVAKAATRGLLEYGDGSKENKLNTQESKSVAGIQKALEKLGYLDTDGHYGYFGKDTLIAINKYKADKGLNNQGMNYGKAGISTITQLEKDLSVANTAQTHKLPYYTGSIATYMNHTHVSSPLKLDMGMAEYQLLLQKQREEQALYQKQQQESADYTNNLIKAFEHAKNTQQTKLTENTTTSLPKDNNNWFKPQVTDDISVSKTLAGTDNSEPTPTFVTLNAVKLSIDEFKGLLGGVKGTVTALEEGIELIPFDNPKNWLGVSAGVDIKQGVAQGCAYLENDDKGLGSAGFGAAATAGQGNAHIKLRLDELNIYANIGGDIGGVGAFLEGSVLDKRSDGTYRILSADGLIAYLYGVNANVDIYLKDRDVYLQHNK